MTRKIRVATALVVALVALGAASCSGGDGTSSASTTQASAPAIKGIEVKDAEIVITGDKVGELKATISNDTKDAVSLRAVACPCAGSVQLGTKAAAGELAGLPEGLPVKAGGSVEIGDTTVVRLTGLTEETVKGATVKLTGYFGDAGQAEFSAKVN